MQSNSVGLMHCLDSGGVSFTFHQAIVMLQSVSQFNSHSYHKQQAVPPLPPPHYTAASESTHSNPAVNYIASLASRESGL